MSSKSQSLLPKRPPPVTDRLAIDGWLDDGGSLAPAREWRSVRRPRSLKLPADTVTGCMDRAAADLLAAAAMTTKNGRLRMEASSASWAERANLIQQMDDSFEAQRKLICDAPPARQSGQH